MAHAPVFRPVDTSRWRDLERLFENRGGPKSCWCMVWRGTPDERRTKESRKAALRARVQGGVPVGILAYVHGGPVGWCSVAPRSTYRPLGGAENERESADEVWSIVCFYVQRAYRGGGLMRGLLEAAIEHAMGQGGKVIEAYPVREDSPSYRFMGFVSTFTSAGFRQVGRAGRRRHVMRLDLDIRRREIRSKPAN